MAISERALERDAALCRVAPRVKVLSRLSWPEATIDEFLTSWKRGEPRLPSVEYALDGGFADARAELERIRDAADPHDPIQADLSRTADSYASACRLLDAAGNQPNRAECSQSRFDLG